MSAQTDYLRAELNAAKASLNNQTSRINAVQAIDNALGILDGRDKLEAAGVTLPAMDASIVSAVYDPISSAIATRNANDVSIKDKSTILTELAAL